MTAAERDILKQEIQLLLVKTPKAEVTLPAENVLSIIDDYDSLLDENRELHIENEELVEDVRNLEAIIDEGEDAA